MRKKAAPIIILTIAILSTSYIFALDAYDTMPNKVENFLEKVSLEGITYDEISIQLSGIQYEQTQTLESLMAMNEEMNTELAHEVECSKLCRLPHVHLAATNINESDNSIELESTDNEETWAYAFTIKNQKDIHYNTYYNLSITGLLDATKLDTLRARGKAQLEKWNVKLTENMYFKGSINGPLSKEEMKLIATEIFGNFDADITGYYEDDLTKSTCAYYGYTTCVKEYVKENNHEKSNIQVGFKYNDELNKTEIIIAFPFYNLPF